CCSAPVPMANPPPRTGPRQPGRSTTRSSPASGPPVSRAPTGAPPPMPEPGAERPAPVSEPVWRRRVVLERTEQTRNLGAHLAAWCRTGDLIVLTGDLGAGKTTLTQGIGAGLGVRGRISSPTFIIARTHAPTAE